MIQGSYSATAQMANRLHSKIKWCVTGTPLGGGKLIDLYSLFSFLNQQPLDSKIDFGKLIGNGTTQISKRILQVLCSHLFLRRTKLMVENELDLPPQTEKINFLNFNAVEVCYHLF